MKDVADDIVKMLTESTIGAQDAREYMLAIRDAVEVHVDREAIRHGLWKDYPAEDQLRQIKIKAERCLRICEHSRGALSVQEAGHINSECDDIINYSTFAKRKV